MPEYEIDEVTRIATDQTAVKPSRLCSVQVSEDIPRKIAGLYVQLR